MTVTGKGIGIGVGVVIETREVLAMLILEILGVLADVIDATKKMEEITGIPTPNEIDQLAWVMIVGRNRGTTVGKIIEMTEWEAVVGDGAMIEIVAEEVEEEEVKSTGQFPLPEMNDWRWSYSALVILGLILANMRISQLRLQETTYHHTSHL